MGSEHLVCARCLGLVAEGRCPTCRAIRDAHHEARLRAVTQFVLVLLALLAASAVLLRFAG